MRLLDKPMIDGDLRLVKNSESVTANAPVNGLGSRIESRLFLHSRDTRMVRLDAPSHVLSDSQDRSDES